MQKRLKLFFALYILIVIKVIVFKYPFDRLFEIARTWSPGVIANGFKTANFVPFHTIKMYIEYAYKLNSFENIAGNIFTFMPFGILFPMLDRKRRKAWNILLNVFLLVLGIEIFQLCSAFGAFDVDDILLNCFGAWLGYIIYCISDTISHVIIQKRMGGEKYGTYFEKN